MSYDKLKFPPRPNMEKEPLEPRELQEIEFAKTYLRQFAHGTSGNIAYSVIGKLAYMLDAAQQALATIRDYVVVNRSPAGDQYEFAAAMADDIAAIILKSPTDAQIKPPNTSKPERPRIICLCGSTKYAQTYQDANLSETLGGNIVLTIGCDMKSDAALFANLTDAQRNIIKDGLDKLHFAKIDLADEIFVLNVGGYIGDSTRGEILHAIHKGKAIRLIEKPSTEDVNGLWGWCKGAGRDHVWRDYHMGRTTRAVCHTCGKHYEYGGWSPVEPWTPTPSGDSSL